MFIFLPKRCIRLLHAHSIQRFTRSPSWMSITSEYYGPDAGQLVDLQQRRLGQHGVHEFKKEDALVVTVNFTRIPWMYPHELLIMCVRPHATIWRMRIDDADDDVVWSLSNERAEWRRWR